MLKGKSKCHLRNSFPVTNAQWTQNLWKTNSSYPKQNERGFWVATKMAQFQPNLTFRIIKILSLGKLETSCLHPACTVKHSLPICRPKHYQPIKENLLAEKNSLLLQGCSRRPDKNNIHCRTLPSTASKLKLRTHHEDCIPEIQH
jgi:hypothetical protein